MMKQLLFLFVFISPLVLFAQSEQVSSSEYQYEQPVQSSPQYKIDSTRFLNIKPFMPKAGLGICVLTYYGDISNKTKNRMGARVGFNLHVSQYLTNYLNLSLYTVFGKLGANESSVRHMNFESTIRSGGVFLEYNFDHFLPEKRMIEPYVRMGLETFEYLSKSDLYDVGGNKYYYWNDGSIRSVDQNSPNAVFTGKILQKDFYYETDLRKYNKGLFGLYKERSMAIPIGIGFTMYIDKRWSFKMGTTMHFTRTDYLDGITPKNKTNGYADNRKDKYLESYFTLSFNLFDPKPPYISPLSPADYLAIENEDSDGDGVLDFSDSCQGTPSGVSVDARGCPADSDGDGILDYADKEINSPTNAIVNADGVALSDSVVAHNWHVWSDSIGEYANYEHVTLPVAIAFTDMPNFSKAPTKPVLTVLLDTYSKGVPPDVMGKLLNISDVHSIIMADSSSAYIAGMYNSRAMAEKRKTDFIASGFTNAKIVLRNLDGTISELTDAMLASFTSKDVHVQQPVNETGVVFRIQLGAYSKKLSNNVFQDLGETVELRTENELYKYLAGAHDNIQDAIKHHGDIIKKGYTAAFVVAYKDGKRVPLSSVSGGMIQPKNENMEEPTTPSSAVDKKLVYFKVQVGAFMNEPPADMMDKFNRIKGLEKKKKPSGITLYIVGKFNDFSFAQKYKDEVINQYGISDAFLVAFFKNEMITIQEALELLK